MSYLEGEVDEGKADLLWLNLVKVEFKPVAKTAYRQI